MRPRTITTIPSRSWNLVSRPLPASAGRRLSFVALPLVATLSACATLSVPAHTTGPARSGEGVEIAVVRQACAQNQDPDFYGDDLVEARVEIELRNPTDDPLTVHREAFRLMAPDGVELPTVTWRAAQPLVVQPRASALFELRFMTRGGLQCAREMRLEADSGVLRRDQPVRIGVVRFLPRSAT